MEHPNKEYPNMAKQATATLISVITIAFLVATFAFQVTKAGRISASDLHHLENYRSW